jgi:hypothetical protein
MTRLEVAKQLGLTKHQVAYREKILDIIGQEYTEKNIELIRNKRNFKVKDKRNFKVKDKPFRSPVKFEIIRLHLLGKSNYTIGILTKIHWRQISNTINEYINNDRCILIDSSINN